MVDAVAAASVVGAARRVLLIEDDEGDAILVRELLAAIKADEQFRTIPVVVLTTSDAQEDVTSSYSLHANAYVTKPVDFERFVDVVRQIDDFFVSVVRLPSR